MGASFADRALLVSVRISAWSARRKDDEITREVARQHDTRPDSGSYTKLLVEKSALSPVTESAGALRAFHYANSLPWMDNGVRLLPLPNYERYSDGMARLRDSFDVAVSEFVTGYQGHVQRARERLNGMFRQSDYPALEDIRRFFEVRVDHWPFPDARDFRVQLGEEEAGRIKANLSDRVAQAQAEAMRDCWVRLYDAIKHMEERLSVPIGADGATFRDSLVENVREICDLLPRLNVAEDPELTRLAEQAKRDLVRPPVVLRADPAFRADTANKASGLARTVAQYMDALKP